MKNKIILHLPHASIKLPQEFYDNDFLVNLDDIKHFNYMISDLFTDDLFSADKYESIKAKYSRLFCDVEKFVNDKKEIMSKYGLGVIYLKDLYGREILHFDKKYKNKILKEYYYPHHKAVANKINDNLKNRKVILVDCHSFSKSTISVVGEVDNLPEICIGVNEITKKNFKLVIFVLSYFENLGYEVMINYPYSGCFEPDGININKRKNFYNIMIEINKSLYLNGFEKDSNYDKVKLDIKLLLKLLENIELEIQT